MIKIYRTPNELSNFFDIFNELFDETHDITSRKCPAHDVIENDNEFIIEMELAGVKKEDISIETEDDVLTIETERKENKDVNYKRKEMYVGKYKRSFILPDNTDAEEIKASVSDGILTITVPKTVNELKEKKQIAIN